MFHCSFDYTVNNETCQVKMKHISFATGDAEKAAGLLAEGYIQHNLAYGTGRDAFVGSFFIRRIRR